MLCEVLPEFPQYVLPLSCNICVNVMSECRQGDGVTVSHNYPRVTYFPSVHSTYFPHKLSLSPFTYVHFMLICERGIILHIFAAYFISLQSTYF